MIDWRLLMPIAGQLLITASSTGGPLAQAVTTFAVDAIEYTIDAVENGADKVSVIQGMQDRIAKLLVTLESA